MDRLYIWERCQFSEWTLSKKAHFIKSHFWQDNMFSWGKKKNDACVDWEGYWDKMSWRGCLSKQGNTRSLFDVYEAEWEEHHPAVSSTCLLQHVTPSGQPHMDPHTQPAQTNRGIKRRMVWKRGKTHLINLPGTFHSTAVCFTSKFTFTWRWKWLIPKRLP